MKKTEKKKIIFLILIAVVLIIVACFGWKAVIRKDSGVAAGFAGENRNAAGARLMCPI